MSTTNADKSSQIPRELVQPLLISIKAAVLDKPSWQAKSGWWDAEGEMLLNSLAERLHVDPSSLPSNPSIEDVAPMQPLVPSGQHQAISQSVLGLCLLSPTVEHKELGKQLNPLSRTKEEPLPPLNYTAATRVFLSRALELLGIEYSHLLEAEDHVGHGLYRELKNAEMKEKAEAARKESEEGWGGKWGRWAATGGGVLLGGLAIGLTSGLAAPVLLPFIPLLTASSAPVVIGSLFGIAGGGLTGNRVRKRWAGVENFEFIQIVGGGEEIARQGVLSKHPEVETTQAPSLLATIIIPGILFESETEGIDSARKCANLFRSPRRDTYVLCHSTAVMLETGQAIAGWVKKELIGKIRSEVLKRTALNAVLTAVALPLSIYSTTGMVIDNQWIRARDKARKAGRLLADVLQQKVQGERPVVLIGASLGALVLLEALRAFEEASAERPVTSPLIDTAIFVSLPAAPTPKEWAQVRKVVGRRMVNAYCSTDLVLAGVGRLHEVLGGGRTTNLAGLCAIEDADKLGIENVDVSKVLSGHFELNQKLGDVLKMVDIEK